MWNEIGKKCVTDTWIKLYFHLPEQYFPVHLCFWKKLICVSACVFVYCKLYGFERPFLGCAVFIRRLLIVSVCVFQLFVCSDLLLTWVSSTGFNSWELIVTKQSVAVLSDIGCERYTFYMLGHVCSLHCTFVVLSSVAPQHRSHSAWIQLACKLYAYLCWNNRKFTLAHDGAPITLFFFFGLPARFNKELQLFVLNSKFVDTDNVDSSTKFTVKNESPSNSLFLLEPHYLTFLFTIFFIFVFDSLYRSTMKSQFFIGHSGSTKAGMYLCPDSFTETSVCVLARVFRNCHYSRHSPGFHKYDEPLWYQVILAGLVIQKKTTGFIFGFHVKHLLFRV